MPCDFQCITRDLYEVQKWKATEFRLFLLYCGPIVLKTCLPDDLYKHFFLLHIACRILPSSDFAVKYNQQAKFVLICFVKISSRINGDKSLAQNMHSLIHLANALYLKSSLPNFTAFPFENTLGKLKKCLEVVIAL